MSDYDGYILKIREASKQPIIFFDSNNREIVKIFTDGTIELGEDYENHINQAARQWWRAVIRAYPHLFHRPLADDTQDEIED
jgi:hypothetical protein